MGRPFLNRIYTIVLQFVFINLINFALGAVFYFSFYMLGFLNDSSNNPAGYREVLYGITIESLFTLIGINIFLVFAPKIKNMVLKYIILAAIIYFVGIFSRAIVFYTWEHLLMLNYYVGNSPAEFIFKLHNLIAGLGVYFLSTRETKRSLTITQQEYELLELKELKIKAELEALQAKINPHFLYNALNSIASLIPENPDKAERMVILLARFFRHSTNAHSQYMTTLVKEVELVTTYLEVEKVRFGERLEYTIWYENDTLQDCKVPQFLIQPLVENAIKHGISKIISRGILMIKFFDQGKDLVIMIYDNGPAFPSRINSGYGLRSTQDKLRLLMGEDAKLDIVNSSKDYSESGEPSFKHIKITFTKQFQSQTFDSKLFAY